MKIVIDTNQLLPSLSVRSKTHRLWEAFRQRKFNLCVTTEILNEYAEIVEQKYNYEVAETTLEINYLRKPKYNLNYGIFLLGADKNRFRR